MHIRKSLWLVAFLLLSLNEVNAERIFILFDANCMDRLEYKQVGQPGTYVVYQVNVAPGERILLEVGQESGEYRGNIPGPVIGCSTGIFDVRMVENINRRIDEVFVINPLSGGRHTISPVSMAGEYQYNQRYLAFNSPEYDFRFDVENGMIGENIAVPGTQREVLFEGRMEEQCFGAYIFRQFAPRSAKPHMDLVLIPEIGITEERSGFTLDEAISNAMELQNVNGIPFDSYLTQLCNGGSTVVNSPMVLSPYGTDVTPATVYDQTPDMAIKTPWAKEYAGNDQPEADNTSSDEPQLHLIAKGETLYRLSKQYGVSIAELKEWNNLKSNTIYKGRTLIVSDPSGAKQADTASNTRINREPVPYGDNGQRLDVSAKGLTSSGQEYHIVRTGETVASIAMKYGYTEERFREMNQLGANDYPKIGQRLKTNDCDCPEVPVNSSRLNQPGRINPYSPGGVSVSTNSTADQSTTAPINNYSYPSPSTYEQGSAQPTTRPFSSYNDTPVPATGTLTAPTTYYDDNRTSTGQPSPYSEYNDTNIRGITSYDNTGSARPSGMKRSHIVKEGEDLYDIARQHGTTVNILRRLNRLDNNEVVIPNQKIYLE